MPLLRHRTDGEIEPLVHPGDQLDGYTLLRRIGRGGFGEVWLCRLADEGEFRALKFIPAARPDHLEKELEALAGYRHAALWRRTPHLVPIEHAGHTAEGFYYVMPLADGTGPDPGDPSWGPLTLWTLIEDRRSSAAWFACEEIASGMAPVLDALQCLTDAGLVHRDVKPDNILFFDGRPVLGDIGLLHEDNATLSGRGTPGYLTPSWYAASHPDMYGAAATLYTWLTGNLPDRMGRSAFNAPPQGDASLSAGERARRKQLLGVVRQATDERPAERYRDFQAMKRALAGPREKKPHRKALVATAVVTAGVLAALGIDDESVPGFPLRLPFVPAGGAKFSGGTQPGDETERWKDRFVLIPAGSFPMGCARGQQGEEHEFPQHDVQVSAFWMQPTEVTNDQMAEVLNWAMARNKVAVSTESVINTEGDRKVLIQFDPTCRLEWDGARFRVKKAKGPGYPCVEVSWYGACACCNYRSQMEGLTPCYNLADWSCDFQADGYRLPTEAEWEKAARGGLAGARFPWPEETISHARANYCASSPDSFDLATTKGFHPDFDEGEQPFTSPAGYFPPNGYGLHDMAGNVWEWCQDWFSAVYYSESPSADPRGPATGAVRVTRGGSWAQQCGCCRVSLRVGNPPVAAYHNFGFRPVRRSQGGSAVGAQPNGQAKQPGTVQDLPPGPPSFASIPAGSFLMGESFPGDGALHELPRHEVQVSAFRMQVTEVTNEQMAEALNWAIGKQKVEVTSLGVMNSEGNPKLLVGLNQVPHCRVQWAAGRFAVKAGKGPGHPCIDVTWYGACAYCNYRSEMDGLTPCYNLTDWGCDFGANGYRLPTEAEWEKAARGGLAGARYPWAEDTIDHTRANYFSTQTRPYDASPARGYHPDYEKGDFAYTSPVGSFPPNGYGLHDMAGNVWEWCQDWFASDSYSTVPHTDPVGPASGTDRVTRGGAWSKDESNCRVACRGLTPPMAAYYGVGFRPVRR